MVLLITGGCIIAWAFMFLPAIVFLASDWKDRFANLLDRFSEDAIKLYFARYFPSKKQIANNDYVGHFKAQMQSRFGGRRFCMPLLLLILIVGITIALINITVLTWLGFNPGYTPLPAIAVSALLGAYMWSTLDQITRFGTGDLTPNDLYTWCFRFLIAVPMGYSLAITVKEDIGIPLAFFLGTFPSDTIMAFGRRFVMKKLDIGDEPADEKTELELIQGINKPEAEKFKDVGITNNLQLAYMDPIDITLRTNYDFNYVIDCMSQALLWLYLDKSINLDKLRALGLRGAYEAHALYLLLNSDDALKNEMGQKSLTEIAKVLGLNEDAFRTTLFQVAEDSYTIFNFEIFNS